MWCVVREVQKKWFASVIDGAVNVFECDISEVVSRIRESNVDVIINLTTGMGGDLFLGPDEEPMNFSDNTDCVGIMERIKHVEELLPEICSLDCGSFNYAEGDYVYISTPNMLEHLDQLDV